MRIGALQGRRLGCCVALLTLAGWNGNGQTLVWEGEGASHLGAPSRDGRFLSGVAPGSGNLLLRSLQTGQVRPLAVAATRKEFAYFSVLSADGEQAAYAWHNEEGFYELRLVGTKEEGAKPRVLLRNAEAGFVQPCAFSPDGERVLTLLFRKDNVSQIAWVHTRDGRVEVLKSLAWVYPKRMDLSPDGEWIVYDNFAGDSRLQRDIFLMKADGSQESVLVGGATDDQFPVFDGEGRAVYFSRQGELWRVAVERPEPKLVRGGLGRFLVLGVRKGKGEGRGQLVYAQRQGGSFVYRSRLNLREAKLAEESLAGAAERLGEGSAVAWAPDGKRIAWLGRRASENFGTDARFVALYEEASGALLRLEPELSHMERIAWSASGDALQISGSDGKGRAGLFALAAAGSGSAPALAIAGGSPAPALATAGGVTTLRPILRSAAAPYTGFPAADPFLAQGSQILRSLSRPAGEGHQLVLTAPEEVTALASHGSATKGGPQWLAYAAGKRVYVSRLSATLTENGTAESNVAPESWSAPLPQPARGLQFNQSGEYLLAATGQELWLFRPKAGNQTGQRIFRATEAIDSFSLHPDDRTLLFAAGQPVVAVWELPLP